MSTNDQYIHGFSPSEQARLVAQAEVLAPSVMVGLELDTAGDLLEIGCGVGAELKLISRRWPGIRLTGLDLNVSHLQAASHHLCTELAQGRIALVRGDALSLPFAAGRFDQLITIWMLEHVPNPVPVIREAMRVLRPGGKLTCTEVDNTRLGFDPVQPAIALWWDRFNSYQANTGGNPFVGSTLEQAARAAGCTRVVATPLSIINSRAVPARRLILLDYLRDLMLSGAANMLRGGYADQGLKSRMEQEFAAVRRQPEVQFHYDGALVHCWA